MFGCTVPSGLLHGILRPNFLIDFTKNSFGKSMNIFWLLAVFHGKLSSFAKKTGTAADDKGSSSR